MGDDILNYQPIGDQRGLWEAGTNLPFDPFDSSNVLENAYVECPRCEQKYETRKSLWNLEIVWARQDCVKFDLF